MTQIHQDWRTPRGKRGAYLISNEKKSLKLELSCSAAVKLWDSVSSSLPKRNSIRRDVRVVGLLRREGVVTNVECETVNTVSLSELDVRLPVIDCEGRGEADDVVGDDDLGDTRLAGHLQGSGVDECRSGKKTERVERRAEVHVCCERFGRNERERALLVVSRSSSKSEETTSVEKLKENKYREKEEKTFDVNEGLDSTAPKDGVFWSDGCQILRRRARGQPPGAAAGYAPVKTIRAWNNDGLFGEGGCREEKG